MQHYFRYQNFIVGLITLLPTTIVFAQTPKEFVRYTTDEGLSHNVVSGLAQDKTGYVWITTAMGLNRFNGFRFAQFHSTDDPNSLAAEELINLTPLDQNRMAVWSGAGLHLVNTQTGQTENIYVPYHLQQYLYKFNITHGVRADDKGNLYLLTRSGFYHFLHGKLVWRFDYYREAEIANTHFHFGGDLFDYDDHRLLLATIDGLYIYDKQKRELTKATASAHPMLAPYIGYTDRPFLFRQYKPGQLFVLKRNSDTIAYLNIPAGRKTISKLPFVATPTNFHYRSRLFVPNDSLCYLTDHTAGFYRLHINPQTGTIAMEAQKFFGAYLCTSLLHDREDRLWVGTNKGLFRQEPQASAVAIYPAPQALLDSFAALRFTSVFAARDKIFVGARGDAGIIVFDKTSGRYERQLTFDRRVQAHNSVNAITPVGEDQLLVATYTTPFLLNTRTQTTLRLAPPNWDLTNDWTNDVYADRHGAIWVSSGENLYCYRQQHQWSMEAVAPPPLNIPVGFEEDREGNVWMASHGLVRLNRKTGRYDLLLDSFPALKMPDKQINAFTFDAENNLWLACSNNGLLCYNIHEKNFRQFSTRSGLPDNEVLDLISIGHQLWITCASGLACLQLATGKITSFGKEDGFPTQPIFKGARLFYSERDDRLYVPFATVVAAFRPGMLIAEKAPPKLFVESLSLSDGVQHYLPAGRFTTPFSQNDATITIGVVGFGVAESQRFAYRLYQSEETPWTELNTQSSFSVAGLSPGLHRIQIKAASTHNRWPAQVRDFYLDVTPPFWRTDWFIGLVSAIFLFGVYELVRWRTSVTRRKEMVKTQIEKLKADDYKAQFELEQISNYFSSLLAAKKTEDDVLWDVVHNLIGRLGYEDCIIYMWNKSKSLMVQKAAFGPKGLPELVLADGFTVAPGQGVVGQVIETGQPVLVRDTRKDSRYRVDDEFRLSEVAVPILHDGELLGVLDSEHSKLDYFSDRDIKVLTTIATLIGNKLKQLQSEQELKAKQAELAGINEQLAEARLSALQAQMNPHFVFNALNSIKRMILDGDNERASRYLSKFANMIRMTLEHSKDVFVTLDENIAYLKAYLEMEKLRFDDSFSYTINTDKHIDTAETVLPSMMLQPLVENAIWHGLLQSSEDKQLRVGFEQIENRLACTVEDNGVGFHHAEKQRQLQRPLHRSVGLENLQKRIRIINEKYSMEASLRIVDMKEAGLNGKGTRAVLEMNIVNL